MHDFEWLLVLLVCAVALTGLARRLKLPFPSLLALGGTAIALLPNTPEFTLDPQLTLALFVAPVLLDAAYDTSLRDLKRFWVPVMCLVVIAVGITTFAVAWLVHALVPAMPWAAAIALGAIVSPPDAAAASAILKQLRIPHRMVVVLEGESLLNDATALIIYRLAVTAAMGTTFTTGSIAFETLAIIGSALVGFLLAHVTMRVLKIITDVSSAIVIQFVTTFGIWILADEIGLSAIVTLVTFAITASRVNLGVTPARMRLPAYAVWETVVFVLNVLAFVLIGLQLGPIFSSLEGPQRMEYLRIAAAVLGAVVLVRLAWVFTYNRAAIIKKHFFGAGSWPGSYVPTLGGSLVISWCGMRGIVTLAAAYALPPKFPFRELILLCAFCVVVGTLIVQGMTLRPLIRLLGLRDDGSVDEEVRAAHATLAKIAAEIIDGDKSPTAHLLHDEFVTHHPTEADAATDSARDARNKLRAKILSAQRQALVRMLETAEIGDDAFHQIEERLDWSEVNVR